MTTLRHRTSKLIAYSAASIFAVGVTSYFNEPSDRPAARFLSRVDPENIDVWINGGGFPAFWWGYGYTVAALQNRRARSLTGYSAGALVSALVSCGVEVESALCTAEPLEAECRVGQMGHILRQYCDRLLPEDCHRRLMDNRVALVMCDPAQMGRLKIVRSWTSKEDVIDSLVASSFVPGFMDLALTDPIHGCIDGWFGTDVAEHRDPVKMLVVSYPVATISLDTLISLNAIDRTSAINLYKEGYSAGCAALSKIMAARAVGEN